MELKLSEKDVLRIGRSEPGAYMDLYRAAPPSVRRQLGARMRQLGPALALRAPALDVWAFNRIVYLGESNTTIEDDLYRALQIYPNGTTLRDNNPRAPSKPRSGSGMATRVWI